MKPSDRQATAELLVALVETAIAHGRRHYSESGELLATTRAVLAKPRKCGEQYDEAIELGFPYQTAADAAWIAGKFQFSRRREKLSWSFHREVLTLRDT